VLVTSLSGDWLLMPRTDFARVVDKELRSDEPLFADLQARHLIMADAATSTLAPLLSQYRTRKAYIEHGPKLHIFVVSLRCHHTCAYCQVSRQPLGQSQFDLPGDAAAHAVERLFEWPARDLTVEFQRRRALAPFRAHHIAG
jgi:hypothetical protein